MNEGKRIIFAFESGVQSLPAAKRNSRLELMKSEPDGAQEQFEFVHLSEFTGEQIKAEINKYQIDKKIVVVPICMAYHGGPLDHPKVTSKSIGEVVAKWDLCLEKLKAEEINQPPPVCLNSDEDVCEKLTGITVSEAKAKEAEGGIHRGDSSSFTDVSSQRSPAEEFVSTISESCARLVAHNTEFVKSLLSKGDMASLFSVISGLCLMRNRLWYFNECIKVDGRCKPFQEGYAELIELVEAVLSQLVEYQTTLMATTILHDPESQKWSDTRAFYEDEKISHCIQMWWYYLQGLRHDIWSSLPPKAGRSVMASVFDKTLSIIVTRYTTVSPTEQRLRHFKGDVTTILLMASEVLMWICVSLDQFFDYEAVPLSPIVRNIHTKCNKLFEALSLVVAPLHVLYKIATESTSDNGMSENQKRIGWLSQIRPGLIETTLDPDQLKAEAHLALQAKLLTHQPEPIWPAIVTLMLSHDMKLSRLILLNFGAFVPGIGNQEQKQKSSPNNSQSTVKPMTTGCEGFQCNKKCLGAADKYWAQAVGSAIVRVAVDGTMNHNSLINLLEDLFDKLSPASWECLDTNQTWNMKKPIWMIAIIQMIEPLLIPALDVVLDKIESSKTLDSNDVRADLKRVLDNILELLELIPVSILKLCVEVEKRLPNFVRPLANSVLVQILVCAIYGFVIRLQFPLGKIRAPRDKTDYILAFGEALLNIKNDLYQLADIQAVANDVLHSEIANNVKERNLNRVTGQSSFILAELIANDLLSSESGRFALKVLYRFINYNADWLQSCLGFSNGGVQFSAAESAVSPMIKPWGADLLPQANPISMMNQIGGSMFDVDTENTLNNFMSLHNANNKPCMNVIGEGELSIRNLVDIRIPWEEYVRFVLTPPMNRMTIEKLMSKRIEFHIDEDDFVGVGSHITLMNGHALPVSGVLQPDERRMLENTFKIIQGNADDVPKSHQKPGKLNKIMVLSNANVSREEE